MATGSISAEEFKSFLSKFVDISNKINDGWHMDEQTEHTVYMRKTCIVHRFQSVSHEAPPYTATNVARGGASKTRPLSVQSEVHQMTGGREDKGDREAELTEDMGIGDVYDTQCMPSYITRSQMLTYEYHIVYSESYQVPVLYFNVYKQDGSLLSLDHVWSMCPSAYQSMLQDSKWTTLTQQEHPLLGRPYLQLHPCHTSEFMSQVFKGPGSNPEKKQNYLMTWLSTVGPMVGLHLAPEYAILPHKKEGHS